MAAAPVPVSDVDLSAHLAALRTDPLAVNPPDWRIDWDDSPWPVKVYRGGRRIPLSGKAPDPLLDRLGRVLWFTFGISRVRFEPHGGLPATPDNPMPQHHGPRLRTRRPIPSGGSMYPTEAYVLLPARQAAYHYDPYRHELTEVGQPDIALGAPDRAAILVLANRFWKNFYKYGDFAYRLGAVDLGVALGRALRLATAEFDHADVLTGFPDREVDAALGLDWREESAYAVLALDTADPVPPASSGGRPPSVVEKSRTVKRSPAFDAAHTAACTDIPGAAAQPTAEPADGPVHRLPAAVDVDLVDRTAMLRRASNGPLCTGEPITRSELATLLHHTTSAVQRLRESTADQCGTDIGLHVAVHRVDGLPVGWYRYRSGDLVAVGACDGDPARLLQDALYADTVNVELAACTVHVTGWADHRRYGRGVRGYRIQQMAVGAAIEALTLTAELIGLSGHPLLGFDARRVDEAYRLGGRGIGVHAQVCVGRVRVDPAWEISVMQR